MVQSKKKDIEDFENMVKKIKFDGFLEGRSKELNREAKVILELLQKHFEVELSDEPDYVFCNVNSDTYFQYDCIRIFCTIEAICPDFNLCDYGIGFEYLDYGDRYFRLPNFYFYSGLVEKVSHKHINVKNEFTDRDFCSFVYSNNRADEMREKLFQRLSEYKKVDSGGKYLNNLPNGRPVADKISFENDHKFSIACENAAHPGYHTEKLAEAFAAQTVPIYWGDPEVEKVFNKKAFINCSRYSSVEEIVDRVKYLDTHPEEYLAMLREPAFAEMTALYGLEKLEDYLVHIFEQPIEEAYRRNRGFWGKQYLQNVRSEKNVVKKYLKLRESGVAQLALKIKRCIRK